jgi:Transposase DDE domain group 1
MSTPVARAFVARSSALAYNLANALRQLTLPRSIRSRNLTVREKLVPIGAKVVTHAKHVLLELAEAEVTRKLFAAILDRIGLLRLAYASG